MWSDIVAKFMDPFHDIAPVWNERVKLVYCVLYTGFFLWSGVGGSCPPYLYP